MLSTEAELLQYLTEQGIAYRRFEHPPVFTCEQAELAHPDLEGVSTKNLFLRDRHRQFFLLMTHCARKVNLKALGQRIGVNKLHFAASEQLEALLGVTAGAVTVLGLVNDDQHRVRLLVDRQIWSEAFFQCHPLVNTATLVLGKAELERFFALTGHPVEPVSLD